MTESANIDGRGRRPDANRGVAVFAVVAASVLASTSFTLGMPGLMAVGEWSAEPGRLRWLVPVMLDGSILTFGAIAIVLRRRHQSAKFAWSWLGGLTVISMVLQVAHVLGFALTPFEKIAIGAVLAASFPAVVFASTHALLGVLWPPPEAKKQQQRGAGRAVVATERVPPPAPEVGRMSNKQVTAAPRSTEVEPRARRAARQSSRSSPDRAVAEPVVFEMRAARPQVTFAQIEQRAGVAQTTAKSWVKAAIAAGRDDLRPVRERVEGSHESLRGRADDRP